VEEFGVNATLDDEAEEEALADINFMDFYWIMEKNGWN
jgi:hypothetical protein